MAHNLFNERFYSLREPAWHGLGTVSQEEKTAVEIFNGMTPYVITLESVFTEVEGMKLELPNRVITRHPTPDDPSYRSFGIVGDEYRIVDPLRTCEIWDESTQRFPETLGVLGEGESLFITTKLPSFSVAGDEVDSYLLLHNPYGGGAIQVRVTPVRVVCQNTLITAKRASTESFRIVHDLNVEDRLAKWMTGIVQRAEGKSEDLRDAFGLMTNVRIDEESAMETLGRVYVDPAHPRYVPDVSIMEKREKAYEASVKWNQDWRERVMEDWQGAGMGMDSEACAGTVWGLYNAVVEVEDYRPTSSWGEASRSYNSIFGDRANRKEAAFTELLEYAESSRT